jgi:hypothetical protein
MIDLAEQQGWVVDALIGRDCLAYASGFVGDQTHLPTEGYDCVDGFRQAGAPALLSQAVALAGQRICNVDGEGAFEHFFSAYRQYAWLGHFDPERVLLPGTAIFEPRRGTALDERSAVPPGW